MKHAVYLSCLLSLVLATSATASTNHTERPPLETVAITNVATVVYTNASGVVITETTNSIGQVKRSYRNPVRTPPARPAPGPRISHTNIVKSAAVKTNALVLASWFDPACTSKAYFQEKVLPELKSGGGYEPTPVSVYAYPNDWYIQITDVGSYEAYSGGLVPDADMISVYSGTVGTYRKYSVAAMPEEQVGEYASEYTNVTFTIYDRDNAVASFEDNIITANGQTNGTVLVYGLDSTGLEKSSSLTLTKVDMGKKLTTYAYETNVTSRFIMNTNIIAKLMTVSTNAADLTPIAHCRSTTHRYSKGLETGFAWTPSDYWYCPKALNRFGTGGALVTNEWTWIGSGANRRRQIPSKANQNFFWPELWDSLRCFTVEIHEAQTSGGDTGWMPYQRIAISPHYTIEVGHYGWSNNHWTRHVTSDHTAATLSVVGHNTIDGGDLGQVPSPSGGNIDIRVARISSAVPSQCIAKFATPEVLSKLSESRFQYAIAFTLTDHQTVNPFVLGAGGSIASSWNGRPGEGASHCYHRDTSLDEINALPGFAGWKDKLASLEHMTHMFNSGDIVFLATPQAKVIPLFMFTSVSAGAYIPYYLETIDQMIRQDSVIKLGTEEHLSYWTFDELYWGGANSIPTIH